MSILSIDFETRSATDLKTAGAWRYFEDKHADVLCSAFALNDGSVETWVRGCPPPTLWQSHVNAGGLVSAHNATFEHWALLLILGPRYGWAVPEPEQWRDTMAQAAAMSIPQALGQAAEALGITEQKDKDGMRLIRKFSIPRKARKCEAEGLYWTQPEDDPADFQKFVEYCRHDVVVERAIRKLLVPLSDAEQKVWSFNLRMNTRGVAIDMPLVEKMLRITDQTKGRLNKAMARATDFEVTACSQVAQLTAWLKWQGVDVESGLAKNDIAGMLSLDSVQGQARQALEIRKEAAKTSTAKLVAMQKTVGKDGRAHGLHLYHGAGTGRWSGRLVQTQNMPRGSGLIKDPEKARPIMLTGSAEAVEVFYDFPMTAVSDMLRSCLIPASGHRLIAADYSSIEGRVTAWVAGEHNELTAYRANDAGTGAGIYEITAGGIFNVDPFKVDKGMRQVGKAASLALGFGGGVLAFHSMAGIYGIDMAPVYPILTSTADPEIVGRAVERHEECLERNDTGTDIMSREAWIASEITKVLWRKKHPATVALWTGLQKAAQEAVETPGTISSYGCISYVVRRGFLWCRLPSGRCLAYGAPRMEGRKTPWGTTGNAVTALGVNSVTKRWERFALYGGLATENVVQAIARDLIAHGMLNAEAHGYPIVMTVHDEAVAEVREGRGSLSEFSELLCDLPAWAKGVPLAATGYEAKFYKKD